MLVGSQLKNAQLEVVADIASLPATDLVIGRIVYVKDQAQLYLYDGAWKALYTKEDVDAAIDTDVNAKSDQITGGSGGAAPANTLAEIDTDIAEIIDGTTTLTGGAVAANATAIAANTVLVKKTTGQTGSFLWTAMGPFSQEVVTDEFFDGLRSTPWDIEFTGMSVCQNMSGDTGATQTMTIMLYDGAGAGPPTGAVWSSGLVLSNTSGSIDTVADYLDSSGDLDTSDLDGTVKGSATMPTWNSASELDDVDDGQVFGLKVTANAIDGTAKVINDVSIQIFWRRR